MAKIKVLNNPGFKPVEFDGFRKQAELNSFITRIKRLEAKDK
ncbi:MAG: hypothetical protein ABFD90_19745 [Phycisphaerales bacterium]